MKYSNDVIDILTEALMGAGALNASEQHKASYRASLQALVRLAKAEQLLEMQHDFNTLTGVEYSGTRSEGRGR